jgi:protein-L-isoaspartate(D-aspartate) O-methyltransferase
MLPTADIELARRTFTEGLRDKAHLRSTSLIEAFAHVPRERFLGDGPWKFGVFSNDGVLTYEQTATSNPAEVYRDAVIAIDAGRGLNNGEPSSLASWIDALDLSPGETIVHIGSGTGYYTAILAEVVGPSGRVLAFEIDPVLALRARANLGNYPQVVMPTVEQNNLAVDSVDAMFVNCGVTHPAMPWVQSLRKGGRLLLPVTAAPAAADDIGYGAMYLAVRRNDGLELRFLSRVCIYHCMGQRSDKLNRELLAKDSASWREVRTLRTDRHAREQSCWLHGPECCMSLSLGRRDAA